MIQWHMEPPSFLLELSPDENFVKQLRIIVHKWDGGYAAEIKVVSNKEDIVNSERHLYHRWIYDNVAGFNCPEVASEMRAVGNGEMTGRAAQDAIRKIFLAALNKYQEVRSMFREHFPRTSEGFKQDPHGYCKKCQVEHHDTCSMTHGCPCCDDSLQQLAEQGG